MIYTLTLNPALDLELTTPELRFDDVLRASAQRMDFGGKGFNVSHGLNALGTRNVAMGLVGGNTGNSLKSGLEGLGISTDFVQIAGETRTNISIFNENRSHHLKINEVGPTIQPTELEALREKVRQAVRPKDWWVLAGSLPPGISPEFYAELVGLVQQAGARALVDTSGEALQFACQAGAFLVKPNQSEAEELLQRKINTRADAYQAVLDIYKLGVKVVVLSLAEHGAVAYDGTILWSVLSPTVSPRSPIGAGDALVAGLVWGYGRRYELQTSLQWGVACGTASASHAGPGIGTRDEIAALVQQVKPTQITL